MTYRRCVDFTPAETRRALEIAAADGRDYLDWPDLDAARARTRPPIPAAAKQTHPLVPMCQTVPKHCQRAPNGAQRTRRRKNEPTADPAPAEGCQTLPNSAKNGANPRGLAKRTHPPFRWPPRAPAPLTPDQLRAARLLVAGHKSGEVAAALRLNRHTVAKWKRLPLFQRELRRLVRQSTGILKPVVHSEGAAAR
jgi:DNA-binding CsgD family transcriptional regulator